uniref:Uncharacterized protein n=1 Tax=Anopheles coluzzii TaxID=1518534 RepID=A0A8W7P8G6_ANOCL
MTLACFNTDDTQLPRPAENTRQGTFSSCSSLNMSCVPSRSPSLYRFATSSMSSWDHLLLVRHVRVDFDRPVLVVEVALLQYHILRDGFALVEHAEARQHLLAVREPLLGDCVIEIGHHLQLLPAARHQLVQHQLDAGRITDLDVVPLEGGHLAQLKLSLSHHNRASSLIKHDIIRFRVRLFGRVPVLLQQGQLQQTLRKASYQIDPAALHRTARLVPYLFWPAIVQLRIVLQHVEPAQHAIVDFVNFAHDRVPGAANVQQKGHVVPGGNDERIAPHRTTFGDEAGLPVGRIRQPVVVRSSKMFTFPGGRREYGCSSEFRYSVSIGSFSSRSGQLRSSGCIITSSVF